MSQGVFLCVQVTHGATAPQWFLLAFIMVMEHEKQLAVSIRTPGGFVHTLACSNRHLEWKKGKVRPRYYGYVFLKRKKKTVHNIIPAKWDLFFIYIK